MSNKQLSPIGGTTSGAGIAKIFPIPIFIKPLAVIDDDLIPVRQLVTNNTSKITNFEFYGQMSNNTAILDHSSCATIRKKLKNLVEEYSYCYLGFAGEFDFTQSWVSVKAPGQEHHPHSHANSIVSGVLYFDNETNCEPISFLRPGTNNNSAIYSMIPARNDINNEYTYTQVTFDVENYMCILFPSYLQHFVNTNQSKVNRYSMAFNAIPKYSLGREQDLTLLNFSQQRKD